MDIINISDFRNNISEFINRIVYNKESFLLKRGRSVVAKVVSIDQEYREIKGDKIRKFAGMITDEEALKIKKDMKGFRTNFKITSV